jgi:hypothetical protein
MIRNILDLLQLDEFYGKSENIEIAKGKYQLPTSVKQAYKQAKRELKNISNGRKKDDTVRG